MFNIVLVLRCLKSCPIKWQSELTAAVSRQFVSVVENEYNLSETENYLRILNECCEHFPHFFFNCVGNVMVFLERNLWKSYDILA